jgi:protein TonB
MHAAGSAADGEAAVIGFGAVDATSFDVYDAVVPAEDARAGLRRGIALVAATLIHALPLAFLLVGLPKITIRSEPPTIPVELVMLQPPKPKPEVLPEPKPEPPKQLHRESGGDPDRAQGAAPAAPAPAPAAPSSAASREPTEPAPTAPAAQKGDDAALPVPVPRPAPPPPSPAPKSVAAVPRPQSPAIQVPNMSEQVGEGGGDRYLNAMRDKITGNLIYPAAARARHVTGVAKYEMLIARSGRLVRARLVQSTGDDLLDQAGLDAIELTAPFEPLPADVPGAQVALVFTIFIEP